MAEVFFAKWFSLEIGKIARRIERPAVEVSMSGLVTREPVEAWPRMPWPAELADLLRQTTDH